MKLSDARAALAAELRDVFSPLLVSEHGGRFTERDIPMVLAQAPGLLVASLGLSDYQLAGRKTWKASVRWAVFCLGADTESETRDVLAMDIATQLIDNLPGNTWGTSIGTCAPPQLDTLTAENLYSGHINNLRVSLWAVSWAQSFTFTAAEPITLPET